MNMVLCLLLTLAVHVYSRRACDENWHVQNKKCVRCYAGTTRPGGDLASGPDTSCTACDENWHVQNKKCVRCYAGTTRPGGDLASGPDTSCTDYYAFNNQICTEACAQKYFFSYFKCGTHHCSLPGKDNEGNVCKSRCQSYSDGNACKIGSKRWNYCSQNFCPENYHVRDHKCIRCPLKMLRAAGDDATYINTRCYICAQNYHVVPWQFYLSPGVTQLRGTCQSCSPGTTRPAGDDTRNDNTACTATHCAINERVASHECVKCSEGTTSLAGADASGDDTTCMATHCAINERVASHECVKCRAGTTSLAGADASGDDTTCMVFPCDEHFHVVDNICIACTSGAVRPSGDDPSGPDTACKTTFSKIVVNETQPQCAQSTFNGTASTVEECANQCVGKSGCKYFTHSADTCMHWESKCKHNDEPFYSLVAWETVINCAQSIFNYTDLLPDALRVRICMQDSESACVESKSAIPLENLRTSNTLHTGAMLCDIDCVKNDWDGPEAYLNRLVYTCTPESHFLYHACNNQNGLHLSISEKDSCSWGTWSLVLAEMQFLMETVHCQMSDWTKWGHCSKTCGTGEESRNRTVMQEPKYGGDQCGELKQEQACNTNPCQVNCEMSDWGPWSQCSKTCGNGTQSHQRTVELNPLHRGDPCGGLEETQQCNVDPCPIYCNSVNITELTFSGNGINLEGTDGSGAGNYADVYCEVWVGEAKAITTSKIPESWPSWSNLGTVHNNGSPIRILCSDSDVYVEDFGGSTSFTPQFSKVDAPHVATKFGWKQSSNASSHITRGKTGMTHQGVTLTCRYQCDPMDAQGDKILESGVEDSDSLNDAHRYDVDVDPNVLELLSKITVTTPTTTMKPAISTTTLATTPMTAPATTPAPSATPASTTTLSTTPTTEPQGRNDAHVPDTKEDISGNTGFHLILLCGLGICVLAMIPFVVFGAVTWRRRRTLENTDDDDFSVLRMRTISTESNLSQMSFIEV